MKLMVAYKETHHNAALTLSGEVQDVGMSHSMHEERRTGGESWQDLRAGRDMGQPHCLHSAHDLC